MPINRFHNTTKNNVNVDPPIGHPDPSLNFDITQGFKGRVVNVDTEKFVVEVATFTGKMLLDVLIPTVDGNYRLPKVGESVRVEMMSDMQPVITGLAPKYTYKKGGGGGGGLGGKISSKGGVASAAGIKKSVTKSNPGIRAIAGGGKKAGAGGGSEDRRPIFTGEELVREKVRGEPEHGEAREDRLKLQPGDVCQADVPGGSHTLKKESGDTITVYSDVNQEHNIKEGDWWRRYFRRAGIFWNGGDITLGDFRSSSPGEKEEDIDINIMSTTKNEKKIRWRFQFGHNIDGGTGDQGGYGGKRTKIKTSGGSGGNQDLQKTECFIGKKTGQEYEEKKIYTKQQKETLEFKAELKDKEEKKIGSIDFLYSDANKITAEIGKEDKMNVKLTIDVSNGDVKIECVKGNIEIKSSEGNIKIDSSSKIDLKAKGQVTVDSSEKVNLKANGKVTIDASGNDIELKANSVNIQ